MKKILGECTTLKRAPARSKKRWNAEATEAVWGVRRAQGMEAHGEHLQRAKRVMRREKRGCWRKFLDAHEGRDLWTVIRFARDHFSMKTTMGTFEDREGRLLQADEEKQWPAKSTIWYK